LKFHIVRFSKSKQNDLKYFHYSAKKLLIMADKDTSKIGQLAIVALKNQNKAVAVFKRPAMPLKQKKSKQIILTEEKYLKVN
jgi:hypothetical protein